jgi:hypothetical protein
MHMHKHVVHSIFSVVLMVLLDGGAAWTARFSCAFVRRAHGIAAIARDP